MTKIITLKEISPEIRSILDHLTLYRYQNHKSKKNNADRNRNNKKVKKLNAT